MKWLVPIVLALPVFAGDNLLRNGDFAEWTDGVPTGWTIAEGARRDDGPESVVKRGDPGLLLEVTAEHRVWRMVTQKVAVKPGATYRLRFEGRKQGIKLEEGQRDNAFVGVKLSAGRPRPEFLWDSSFTDAWTPGSIVFASAELKEIEVLVFLAKTGSLGAKGLHLEELRREDSYDVMVDQMARYYSYFDVKKLDWAALAAKHREAALAAKDEAAFLKAAGALLAELGDLHVVLLDSRGAEIPTFLSQVTPNIRLKELMAVVPGLKTIGRAGLAGTTPGGFGYLAVATLVMDDATLADLIAAVDAHLDAPGFLIDLRGNSGGNELRAYAIASIFADKPRVYAKHSIRCGPKPTDLSVPEEVVLQPRKGKTFTKPVVVLIGPACVSSGEGFAKMMKALPHVKLVGQPTRGASANPKPLPLPNGVTVRFSTWVDMLPDGTIIEGRGVAPDVLVEHTGEGDPTLRAAVKELEKLLAK